MRSKSCSPGRLLRAACAGPPLASATAARAADEAIVSQGPPLLEDVVCCHNWKAMMRTRVPIRYGSGDNRTALSYAM